MIFTGRFFLALAIAILLSLGSIWQPDGTRLSVILTALLLIATVTDWWLIPQRLIRIKRETPAVIMQGLPVTITLLVSNFAPRSTRLRIRDSFPPKFVGPAEPLEVFLADRSQTTLEYSIRSYARGQFHFG